jgi:hypothetical protein
MNLILSPKSFKICTELEFLLVAYSKTANKNSCYTKVQIQVPTQKYIGSVFQLLIAIKVVITTFE